MLIGGNEPFASQFRSCGHWGDIHTHRSDFFKSAELESATRIGFDEDSLGLIEAGMFERHLDLEAGLRLSIFAEQGDLVAFLLSVAKVGFHEMY